jgi:hypothetical protein
MFDIAVTQRVDHLGRLSSLATLTRLSPSIIVVAHATETWASGWTNSTKSSMESSTITNRHNRLLLKRFHQRNRATIMNSSLICSPTIMPVNQVGSLCMTILSLLLEMDTPTQLATLRSDVSRSQESTPLPSLIHMVMVSVAVMARALIVSHITEI